MNSLEIENWKKSYLMKDFNVDQCLSNCTQKADLLTLRKDLKQYCTELQSQMLEILKNETDAIVDLAVHLTKLNTKILNLLIPFSQFQENVKNMCNVIDLIQKDVTNTLEKLKSNRTNQNYIHLVSELYNYLAYVEYVFSINDNDISNNILLMERISNNFAFQHMQLKEQQQKDVVVTDSTKHIESTLLDNLSKCFLNAYKKEDINVLIKCLKMYSILDKHENAYDTFRQNIIQPELEKFTEKYLESVNYDLEKVFNIIKQTLDCRLDILISITTNNATDEIKSFNFVLHSFWKAIDVQFTGLHYITAPGNPELFHQRFMATYKLLQYIAAKAGNPQLVHYNESFQNHLKRFNLPVYFEIRFQQIAGHFESELSQITFGNIYTERNEHAFRLAPSLVFWISIEKCLNKDIYIHQLADQFIRLILLVLSRYIKFIKKLLMDESKTASCDEIDNYVLNTLVDLKIIKSLLLLNGEVPIKIEKSPLLSQTHKNIWPVLGKILLENGKLIDSLQLQLQQHLTKSQIGECNKQLVNVTSIPRLYRRTNRNLPTEPSLYVIDAIKPIVVCYEKFQKTLQEERISEIIYTEIIVNISEKYLTLIQEVLMSVCKTEESLKKFKSRSSKPSDISNDENKKSLVVSDEMKIREQIKLDIDYFYNKLYSLGTADSKKVLDTLKQELYKQ